MQARLLETDDPLYEVAIRRALSSPTQGVGAARELLHGIGGGKQGNTPLVVAGFERGRLVTASCALIGPGHSALLFLPDSLVTDAQRCATSEVVATLLQLAHNRGVVLIEALLPEDGQSQAQVLNRAGFEYLTRLLYLQRPVGDRVAPPITSDTLDWQSFSEESAPLFASTLRATYAQTLDCPRLSELRDTCDVLADYQATGRFNPSWWWLAKRANEPVGVVLLNGGLLDPMIEIVYLGVAQPARGTGVADALLERAVQVGRAEQARVLTLAVDRSNTPARRLYARWGFMQFSVRDAWIATLRSTER